MSRQQDFSPVVTGAAAMQHGGLITQIYNRYEIAVPAGTDKQSLPQEPSVHYVERPQAWFHLVVRERRGITLPGGLCVPFADPLFALCDSACFGDSWLPTPDDVYLDVIDEDAPDGFVPDAECYARIEKYCNQLGIPLLYAPPGDKRAPSIMGNAFAGP